MPAEIARERFGGMRKWARAIGRPYSTVQRWVESGIIPAKEIQSTIEAGRRLGIVLNPDEMIPPQLSSEAA